jgi:hypothetical protein
MVKQFELYWGESAEASLAAVVGLLDPGDDREAEFFAGVPALPVENVLLQQGENDSIAALSPQAPPGPSSRGARCGPECG